MTDDSPAPSRSWVLAAIVVAVFLVFFGRLIQLQVIYVDEYGKKSQENSIRSIASDPLRGYIYDRNGVLIVENRPAYTVTVTPSEFQEGQTGFLARVLGTDSVEVATKIRRGFSVNRFIPVKVKRDVNFATLSILEEHREKLRGVEYIVESARDYPTGARAAHLLGYTTEVSDNKIARNPGVYESGDLIGAIGLEAAYEPSLRGKKGFQLITVNASGESQGPFNEGRSDVPVTEGDDLWLHLDIRLQQVAESLLTGMRGAVVAIDPETGGVLALASMPDFDPGLLGGAISPEFWKQLNTDPAKPLFNRATMTRYPPGSTIKMMGAAAALQDHVISPHWGVECTGGMVYGNRMFKDLHVHGNTGVVESIERSCNVFYYSLILKTGLERWHHYGAEFGFGIPTGIDIGEENSGLLPSAGYYDRVYGKGKWTQGYLISLSIGQGELGASPLQMANYAAALANKGYIHSPRVVAKVHSKQTDRWSVARTESRLINIDEAIWRLLREGMERAVNSASGTASLARVEGVKVAGKTGTAQNPHGKDHAWFVGFAPYDAPKIAICVLVENSGFGGTYAAPIAGRCIEQYLFGVVRQRQIVIPEPAAVQAEAD
jgi:penicillin-binding protein 2